VRGKKRKRKRGGGKKRKKGKGIHAINFFFPFQGGEGKKKGGGEKKKGGKEGGEGYSHGLTFLLEKKKKEKEKGKRKGGRKKGKKKGGGSWIEGGSTSFIRVRGGEKGGGIEGWAEYIITKSKIKKKKREGGNGRDQRNIMAIFIERREKGEKREKGDVDFLSIGGKEWGKEGKEKKKRKKMGQRILMSSSWEEKKGRDRQTSAPILISWEGRGKGGKRGEEGKNKLY